MIEDKQDPPRPDYRRIPGMDPAANWLLGIGQEDFFPEGDTDAFIPFLMELAPREFARFRKVTEEANRDETRIVVFSEEAPSGGGDASGRDGDGVGRGQAKLFRRPGRR